MEVLEYEPPSKSLDLDLEKIDCIRNRNVLDVALRARNTKRLVEKDPNYRIHGTYSEAYQGEQA